MVSQIHRAFAPLPREGRDGATTAEESVDAVVCTPVPEWAMDPTQAATHLFKRSPDKVWSYFDQKGQLLAAVARWNKLDDKVILPLAWVRERDGSEHWAFKNLLTPRPIYNLHHLADRPDATVVVGEGEKTADAGAIIFPEYVAITSPGGAYAAGQADWGPLNGRRVLIAPDANDSIDEKGSRPGDVYMNEVARQALQHGAAEVSILDTAALSRMRPDGSTQEGPTGWDLAQGLEEGWTPDTMRTLIDSRPDLLRNMQPSAVEPSAFVSFGPFTMDPRKGLCVEIEHKKEIETHWLSTPFEVLGRVRTPNGQRWARLVRWRDDDGREHTHSVADSDLHGDLKALVGPLASGGLRISITKARPHLAAYLNGVKCDRRVTMLDHTGWNEIDEQLVFALPNQSFGLGANERIVLSNGAPALYAAQGSLEDWKSGVGNLVRGHARLTFAVSAAFAGTLLRPMKLESGGFNLYGDSSSGKSTAGSAAGSVFGRAELGGFVRSWRATANALEGAAALHTDTILVLDELGLVEPKDAATAVYQLVSGLGKGRSERDGTLGSSSTWHVMVLSTGEMRLADKLREGNRRILAGQSVRFLDIPADAGQGFGIFDHLGEYGSSIDLVEAIKRAATTSYGTAGPAFIEGLLGHGLTEVERAVGGVMAKFRAEFVQAGADGQVLRAADRFALIGAAGELANILKVVPWREGDAYSAAGLCFQAWLNERGGVEAAEITEAIATVRRFVEAHGASRFENLDSTELFPRPINNRAGYRRGSGAEEQWWVLPEAWKSEVCAGLGPTRTARILSERGMLVQGGDGLSKVQKVAGLPKRVYVLTSKILAGGPDE